MSLNEIDIKIIAESIFNSADKNNSGYIEIGELPNIMNTLAIKANIPAPQESDISTLLKELDIDNDNRMSLHELTLFISAFIATIGNVF